MAKKLKLTTKTGYKNGYEAAQANQPRQSPHRDGTASEELWFAGFDAFTSGGRPPEEPRKRRSKVEVSDAKFAPPSQIPTSLVMRKPVSSYVPNPRGDGIMEHMIAAKATLAAETDVELREILHMDLADLEWLIFVEKGDKPSTRWEEYKTERGLNFDRKVA